MAEVINLYGMEFEYGHEAMGLYILGGYREIGLGVLENHASFMPRDDFIKSIEGLRSTITSRIGSDNPIFARAIDAPVPPRFQKKRVQRTKRFLQEILDTLCEN